MIREIFKDEFVKIIDLGKLIKNSYDLNQISDLEKIFVYEINNNVVAFIQIQVLYETLEIINIVVNESMRKNGIASKLLDYVIEYFKPEHILLEVRDHNMGALEFYKKHNFKEIRRIKNYYVQDDAIVMEKVL